MARKNEDPVMVAASLVPDDTVAKMFTGERVAMPHPVIRDVDDDEVEIRRLEAELESDRLASDTVAGPVQVPDVGDMSMRDAMVMLAAALRDIASGQVNAQMVAAKALESAQRQVQPDNKQAPMLSVLNPQGELQFPKPKLKCRMDIPWECENESCTWEEVELLNLLEDGEYVIKRNDNSKVGVIVKLLKDLNGKPNRLFMNSEMAFTEESHWRMPPLTSILRQILAVRPHTAAAASKVLTMDQRYSMVENGELEVSVGMR